MTILHHRGPVLHRTVATADVAGPDMTTFNRWVVATGIDCEDMKFVRVDIVPSDTALKYDIVVYGGDPKAAGAFFPILPEYDEDQTSLNGNKSFRYKVDGRILFVGVTSLDALLTLQIFVTPMENFKIAVD